VADELRRALAAPQEGFAGVAGKPAGAGVARVGGLAVARALLEILDEVRQSDELVVSFLLSSFLFFSNF
jgi:hypothetical protein